MGKQPIRFYHEPPMCPYEPSYEPTMRSPMSPLGPYDAPMSPMCPYVTYEPYVSLCTLLACLCVPYELLCFPMSPMNPLCAPYVPSML